jgi:hypothetical protein
MQGPNEEKVKAMVFTSLLFSILLHMHKVNGFLPTDTRTPNNNKLGYNCKLHKNLGASTTTQ